MKSIDELIKETAEFYGTQIRHEDTLFNQRLSWLVNFQGFLVFPYIAIYAWQWQFRSSEGSLDSNIIDKANELRFYLCSFGLTSVLLVLLGLLASDLGIKQLNQRYEERFDNIIKTHSADEQQKKEFAEQFFVRPKKIVEILGAILPWLLTMLITVFWLVLSYQNNQTLFCPLLLFGSLPIIISGFLIFKAFTQNTQYFAQNIYNRVEQEAYALILLISIASLFFFATSIFVLLFNSISNWYILLELIVISVPLYLTQKEIRDASCNRWKWYPLILLTLIIVFLFLGVSVSILFLNSISNLYILGVVAFLGVMWSVLAKFIKNAT